MRIDYDGVLTLPFWHPDIEQVIIPGKLRVHIGSRTIGFIGKGRLNLPSPVNFIGRNGISTRQANENPKQQEAGGEIIKHGFSNRSEYVHVILF